MLNERVTSDFFLSLPFDVRNTPFSRANETHAVAGANDKLNYLSLVSQFKRPSLFRLFFPFFNYTRQLKKKTRVSVLPADTFCALILFILQTSKKFTSELNNTGVAHSKFAGQTYDAVWAMALALAETEVLLNRQNESMAQYTHTRKDFAQLLLEQLKDLRFIGVSVSRRIRQIKGAAVYYVHVREARETPRESVQNCLTQIRTYRMYLPSANPLLLTRRVSHKKKKLSDDFWGFSNNRRRTFNEC